MKNKIRFNYADRRLMLTKKQKIKDVIELLFKKEKQSLNYLNYVFCSDDYLLKINQSFLNHDYYTDIITFDLSEPGDKEIKGEVYISLDRVKDNSQIQKTAFNNELVRVIIHGALHLCGHKDKTQSQQSTMRELEEKYIRIWQQSFT